MTRLLWITAVLLALIGSATPAVCADAPARRADAYKLVQIAEDACRSAIHALQAPGISAPQAAPLRSALERMGKSLAEIQARLNQRDMRFFDMLGTGSRTLAEVAVVWPRTGLADPAVDREIRSLDAAYGRLRNRYGAEWLRFQAGQTLSADELRRFQALQAMQAAFAARLAVLIEKARQAGDAATARDLGLLMSQANAIAQAPPTLDEMLNAEVLADAIQGEYNAVRDANPEDDADWDVADQVADELRTDPSVGFVFTADLRSGTKWTYTEVETDVPAAVADDDIRSSALDEALAAGPSQAAPVLLEVSGPDGTLAALDQGVDVAAAVDDAEATEGTETGMAMEMEPEPETGNELAAPGLPLPASVTAVPAKEPVKAAAIETAVQTIQTVPSGASVAADSAKSPLRCFLL
jgi:hypothetical protein